VPGSWLDSIPVVDFALLIPVITYQVSYQPIFAASLKSAKETSSMQFRWDMVIPPLGILVAYTLYYYAPGRIHPMSTQVLSWIIGFTIGLALIRQFISQRNNMSLARKLQQELIERETAEKTIRVLNNELESRVLERTAALTREIAQRKQAQADRERLITELKAKNTELERFTHTVSHDLKAPLITIRGFLGLVEKDALAGNIERVRSDMSRVNEATEKMGRLLTELLELSRVGRMMNPPQAVEFGEIVRESIELVAGRITERGIKLEITPGLPVVFGDRLRLVQVMQNLIDNATKFMGSQPAPCIVIGCEGEEDGKPIFYVKDNGIGIEPGNHEKIFSLFDKLDPHSEGTGVGLTLVKRILEVHGGRIWMESAGKDLGTTFYFTLPTAEMEYKRIGEN